MSITNLFESSNEISFRLHNNFVISLFFLPNLFFPPHFSPTAERGFPEGTGGFGFPGFRKTQIHHFRGNAREA
jgi:hypothetical protein